MTTDLLQLTATLMAIPSVSRHEQAIVEYLERQLTGLSWLDVVRVGDNLIARTDRGCDQRLVLAGHTDTVPVNGNAEPKIVGDRLSGLGASDMKGGLAVMLEAARTIDEPAVDVTYVFYAREEIDSKESGLGEVFELRPDLLVGDVALLGEPTDGAIEAGCQGTMHLRVELRGERAHTARPWKGRNAIYRLGPVLASLSAYEGRRPVLEGCEYREALQAVRVEGGVAGNVVPDHVELFLNHRFAPDRTPAQAEDHVRALLETWLEPGDVVEVVDVAAGAAPAIDHPLLAGMIQHSALDVRAKLGWTDVSRFAAHGIPAANFGPGDPTIAHTAGEFVDRSSIEGVWAALSQLLRHGAGPTG